MPTAGESRRSRKLVIPPDPGYTEGQIMPELPDLVYIEKTLHPLLLDREIRAVTVWEPIVLRAAGSPAELLCGRRITELGRRGPFMVFDLPPLQMIVHFMLAGRFRYQPDGQVPTPRRQSSEHCFSLALSGGAALHYLDSRRMGKVYVVGQGETAGIPGFDSQGVDVLSEAFSLQRFRKLIAGRRHQVRVFLMDQSTLSAIGNAYADEILFQAGIHPKTGCNQLKPPDIDRLHASIRSVLQWGIEEVEKAGRPIDLKVREHLKVRNRRGQPCPVCGTVIRRAGVLGYDSFFCPSCQPALRRQAISWEKLP